MYWTTPKTDWNQGDHFNLEDYIRINDNIAYLKDMAAEIYPQSELYAICFRERNTNMEGVYCDFFSLMDMVVANMQTYPSKNYQPDYYDNYDYGLISFLYRDRSALLTLLKLDYLSLYGVTSVENVLSGRLRAGFSEGWWDSYYTGYAINYAYSQPTFLPYTAFWTKRFGSTLRSPIAGFLTNLYTYDEVVVRSGYPLANEPFWSYTELNIIESRILTIYNRLSNA